MNKPGCILITSWFFFVLMVTVISQASFGADRLHVGSSIRVPKALDEGLLGKEHYVWETAVWICVSGRKLVKRADGTHRLIPAEQVLPTDTVLPNELRPCRGHRSRRRHLRIPGDRGAIPLLGLLPRRPATTRLPSARHYRHCTSRFGRPYRVTDVSDRDWLRRLLNTGS